MTKYLQIKVKDQVIAAYLNGKSRDQIARECSVSGGTVSAIIKEWKKRIKVQDLGEIRDLLVLIRKSEMTVEQCSIGFRVYNRLKSIGIEDREEDDKEKEESIDNLNFENNKYYELLSFLKEIYFICKKFGIKPSILFTWIEDLFECQFSLSDEDSEIKEISDKSRPCSFKHRILIVMIVDK